MLKHSRKRQNNKILIAVVVAIILIAGLIFLVKNNSNGSAGTVANPAQVDALAQCLTDKGAKMYGASWCPHCKAQRAMFGTSFSKIDYVECTTDQVKCNIAGIQGYPTWIYQGQKYEGEKTFSELAKITGCTYDGENVPVSSGETIAQ